MIIAIRLILVVSFMLCLAQTRRISRLADRGWAASVRTACKELAAGFVTVAALTYVVAVDDHSRVMSQLQSRDKVIQQLSAMRGQQISLEDVKGLAFNAKQNIAVEMPSGNGQATVGVVHVTTHGGNRIVWPVSESANRSMCGGAGELRCGSGTIRRSGGELGAQFDAAYRVPGITERTVKEF